MEEFKRLYQRISFQDPSKMMDLDPNEGNERGISQGKFALFNSKRLQSELEAIGIKIKQLEDNLKSLKSEKTKLDESIIDLQVQYEDSATAAAGVQTRHSKRACQIRLTKDRGGGYVFIVAKLGKVNNDNLNQVLSEYLGTHLMLAVVCKNYDEVKKLETYDNSSNVDRNDGFQGVASSFGETTDLQFHAISLENLRPYVGPVIADDPQRRLDLVKPTLPNGELPPGFLDFAVNMILIDPDYLHGVTSFGYGLRETLFYSLFSDLQVYKTRVDMINAVPCISHSAISLDGGAISKPGIFMLECLNTVKVRFAKPSDPRAMEDYSKKEKQMKELKWKKERVVENIMCEQVHHDQAMFDFRKKKEEFIQFLVQNSAPNQSPKL